MARSPYSAGHFELSIDGHPATSYLKSVEGGNVKLSVGDASFGNDNVRVKAGVVNEIEPISIEFGMANSGGVLKWIQQSWRKEWSTRDGQITHADFNMNATMEHQFTGALITETSFPTLDGKLTEPAMMKVKMLPAGVLRTQVSGNGFKLGVQISQKQKAWSPARFRMSIDGHDGFQYANKIDGFTIKQEVSKMYSGVERYPLIAPAAITFPNITGTVAEAKAGGIMQWFNKVSNQGMVENQAQTSGCIEYLAPNLDTVLFRLNLFEVGILYAGTEASQANSDTVKRVKFELFVGRMDLDGDNASGLDGVVNSILGGLGSIGGSFGGSR
jgi:hypothetical protein